LLVEPQQVLLSALRGLRAPVLLVLLAQLLGRLPLAVRLFLALVLLTPVLEVREQEAEHDHRAAGSLQAHVPELVLASVGGLSFGRLCLRLRGRRLFGGHDGAFPSYVGAGKRSAERGRLFRRANDRGRFGTRREDSASR